VLQISRSFGPFTPEDIADRLMRMTEIRGRGLTEFEEALTDVAGPTCNQELSAARAVWVSRSTANYYRLLLKRAWSDEYMPKFSEIVDDELTVLRDAIPVCEADPRQSFHIEGHGYMVTPDLLRSEQQMLREAY